MRGARHIVVLACLVMLALPAIAGAEGSAGHPTGSARPTGVWAESDSFWTWAGAVWLHVGRSPGGGGYVRSRPLYLVDCPKACTRPFDPGSVVTLTAHPSEGMTFAGWEGPACVGQPAACTFTIGGDTIVTALFTGQLVTPQSSGDSESRTVRLTVVNELSQGSVTGTGGFACPPEGSCSKTYPRGTNVALVSEQGDGTSWDDPANGGGQGCMEEYAFKLTSTRTVTVSDEC